MGDVKKHQHGTEDSVLEALSLSIVLLCFISYLVMIHPTTGWLKSSLGPKLLAPVLSLWFVYSSPFRFCSFLSHLESHSCSFPVTRRLYILQGVAQPPFIKVNMKLFIGRNCIVTIAILKMPCLSPFNAL